MNESKVEAKAVKFYLTWIFHSIISKAGMALATCIVILFACYSGLAYADAVYSWTKTMGGTGGNTGYSTALDSSGNVYVTGFFTRTVDFDPGAGTDNHTSSGNDDIFLTKIIAGIQRYLYEVPKQVKFLG